MILGHVSISSLDLPLIVMNIRLLLQLSQCVLHSL